MKTKAVIFDFDGTLSRGNSGSNSWGRVWKALDDEETDNKFYQMFARGEIDDPTWNKLIEYRFKELKMPESLLDGLAEKIELMPGVERTFKHFYDNGVRVYVVSGGVKNLIEAKLAPFKKYITRIEGYQFKFKNGIFCGFEETKDCLDDKHKYVDVIRRENAIRADEILFVGNGSNDQTVYLSGARTLCINPDDADYKNSKYWNFYIENCGDLFEITQFLNKEKPSPQMQK